MLPYSLTIRSDVSLPYCRFKAGGGADRPEGMVDQEQLGILGAQTHLDSVECTVLMLFLLPGLVVVRSEIESHASNQADVFFNSIACPAAGVEMAYLPGRMNVIVQYGATTRSTSNPGVPSVTLPHHRQVLQQSTSSHEI